MQTIIRVIKQARMDRVCPHRLSISFAFRYIWKTVQVDVFQNSLEFKLSLVHADLNSQFTQISKTEL